MPFLKYPANPPSIGDPDTIQYRTADVPGADPVSVVAMVVAVMLQRRLVERFGGWNATLIAGGAYLVVIGAVLRRLPRHQRSPATSPAVGGRRGDRC